ncbi:MAG: heme-copper oxidase subunit III [Acidimicrobiia bacterium]
MALDRAALEPPHEQAHTSTGVSNVKLAMWVFLSTECLFFGAFISTYLLYRGRATEGLTPGDVYDIPFTSATSFILLMSSLTMVLALAAIERNDIRRTRVWLLATGCFGLLFLSGQIFEFTEFVREGVAIYSNAPSSAFFVLTGIHGLHVAIGIIWLLILFAFTLQNRLTHEHSETVEVAGLYWHFVDIVWIVIFVVVYLIPE